MIVISLDNSQISPLVTACNLGVTMENDPFFSFHTAKRTHSYQYLLYNIRRICLLLCTHSSRVHVQSLVNLRLQLAPSRSTSKLHLSYSADTECSCSRYLRTFKLFSTCLSSPTLLRCVFHFAYKAKKKMDQHHLTSHHLLQPCSCWSSTDPVISQGIMKACIKTLFCPGKQMMKFTGATAYKVTSHICPHTLIQTLTLTPTQACVHTLT